MTFKKGQSGNPSGRPAVVRDFRERCRDYMQRKGWSTLEELANHPGRDQYRAVELLTAYAYGRPTQPISGDADPETPPIQVTVVFDKPDADAGSSE